jgi:hypothetical protein
MRLWRAGRRAFKNARLWALGLSDRAELISAGHERVSEFVEEPVDAAAFNLGWLPGGGKAVTARVETTMRALDACAALLKPRGLLTACLPRPRAGPCGLDAIREWARALPDACQAMAAVF